MTDQQTDQQATPSGEGEPKRDLMEVVGGLLRGEQPPAKTDAGELRGDGTPADPDEAKPAGELSDEGLGLQPDAGKPDGDVGAEATSALQALAEKAGVSVKELYKVQIPLGNEREPVSIGDLKDQFQQVDDLKGQRDTFDQTRTAFENDMIRSRAELQEIVALLPEVPAALIERGQASHAANIAKQRELLHNIKPEWKDPEVFARVQDNILNVVQEYGFTRPELESITDHRLTKLLHDFFTMRQRFSEANASRKRLVDDASSQLGRKKGSKRTEAKRASAQKLTEAATAPMHSPTKLDAVKGILANAAQQPT